MKRSVLLPWMVTSGDCQRYLGRALAAALAGRAVLIRRGRDSRPVAMLVGIDKEAACYASVREYVRGRYRFVRLGELSKRARAGSKEASP